MILYRQQCLCFQGSASFIPKEFSIGIISCIYKRHGISCGQFPGKTNTECFIISKRQGLLMTTGAGNSIINRKCFVVKKNTTECSASICYRVNGWCIVLVVDVR